MWAINVLTPSADNLARTWKATAAFKVTSGWVHRPAVHMQPKTNIECRCLWIVVAQWAHKLFILSIQLDLSGCFRALFGKLFTASPHDVCHNSTPARTFAYDDRLNAAIYVQVAWIHTPSLALCGFSACPSKILKEIGFARLATLEFSFHKRPENYVIPRKTLLS